MCHENTAHSHSRSFFIFRSFRFVSLVVFPVPSSFPSCSCSPVNLYLRCPVSCRAICGVRSCLVICRVRPCPCLPPCPVWSAGSPPRHLPGPTRLCSARHAAVDLATPRHGPAAGICTVTVTPGCWRRPLAGPEAGDWRGGVQPRW